MSETLDMYSIKGAEKKASGKSLVQKGAKRAVGGWSGNLTTRVFAEPVLLEFGALAPHATSAKAKAAGWKRKKSSSPRGVSAWMIKRVPLEGNLAQLHREIRKAMKESGDYHHVAFELLTRVGTKNGVPIYEVGMGS